MTESFDHSFDDKRDEKEKSNSSDQREGKKARTNESPNSPSRFGFHAPNNIERALQLAEHATGAEQGEREPNGSAERALGWSGNLVRDLLHHIDRAFVQKVTHLLGDFAPRAGRIVAKQNADDRD